MRRFGDFVAVKGISFHVKRGEIFGLLGANGAGKTTTFRMLCGLPASRLLGSGLGGRTRSAHRLGPGPPRIRIHGGLKFPSLYGNLTVLPEPARSAQARGRIGYMAQKFSLYGNLTVLQNLRFFASAYNLKGNRQRKRSTSAGPWKVLSSNPMPTPMPAPCPWASSSASPSPRP